MITRLRIYILGILMAALWAAPLAAGHLTVADLARICSITSPSSAVQTDACSIYIRGFVDGAIATDERVTFNVAREVAQRESYSERAYRTRLGRQLDRYGPSYYAGICLGNPAPIGEAIDHIRDSLDAAKNPDELASEFVYQFLTERFPCEQLQANRR